MTHRLQNTKVNNWRKDVSNAQTPMISALNHVTYCLQPTFRRTLWTKTRQSTWRTYGGA